MNIIATKLAEPSTWTGLFKLVAGVAVLYTGQTACGAQPSVDLSGITLGQIAGHLGLTDLLGSAALLVGGYDVVRKEAARVAPAP